MAGYINTNQLSYQTSVINELKLSSEAILVI